MESYWEIPGKARYRFELETVADFAFKTSTTLGSYRDEIESARISTVQSIVVLPARPWRFEQTQLFLFAFGTFSSVFRTIELLSMPLAKQYRQRGVLPIVRPVLNPGKNRDPENAELLRRRFKYSGLLLIDRPHGV